MGELKSGVVDFSSERRGKPQQAWRMQGTLFESFSTGQYCGFPSLAMGTSLIRACCETLTQASVKGTSSRRLEDLMVEVDEARKENQRLNRQVLEMRRELDPRKAAEPRRDPRIREGREGREGRAAEPEPRRRESKVFGKETDTQQLQHLLSELQRENAQLRAGPQVQRGHVSLSQYQHLQQQVHDLQRATNQFTGAPRSVPSNYSYRGSRFASGRETPMSGVSSPQRQWGLASHQYSALPSETGTQGSAMGAEDFRRRLSAMQRENEILRNKAMWFTCLRLVEERSDASSMRQLATATSQLQSHMMCDGRAAINGRKPGVSLLWSATEHGG
eukprot:s989_g1.t1